MNREEALAIVEKHLTPKRYIHTIGVADTAIKLAEHYGADVKKAELAGIFHDYAKFREIDFMRQVVIDEKMPQDLLIHHPELLHAPVGAYLVEKEVGITDTEILSAIRNHTTGKAGMSLLDKIVYLADYIEPNRAFPKVEETRELAFVDLDLAILKSISNSITHLLEKEQLIYPETINFYNDLRSQKENN